jgi:hypothetical protein
MLPALPEKCSMIGCYARATHLLDYADPSPLLDEPRRVRDGVCEECGTSYMRTNHVKRQRPVLLRNGTALSAVAPRIRVRVQQPDEPGANKIDDWEDEDAVAIRAGRDTPMVIEIIDGAGEVLNDCLNRIASPKFLGVYDRPSQILDRHLAYAAADHWTPCFGIQTGDWVVHRGDILSVVDYEQVDQDYGDIGANTGWVICQSTSTSTRRPIWVEVLKKVRGVTA